MSQIGYYGMADLQILVAHDGVVLCEIQDFSYNWEVPKAPGGAGVGCPYNRYHKITGAPNATFSISRNSLSADQRGNLFKQMIAGAGIIITEAIATASTTYTPGQTLTSILAITLADGTLLEESDDYTVNYASGVITFTAALTQAAEIMYMALDSSWIGLNKMLNTSFEDIVTGTWSVVTAASATVARSTGAKYVGTYGLNIGSITADAEGAKYEPDIAVYPNRTYRLSFWAESDQAEGVDALWTDSGGTTSMTAVGTAATLATSFKLHEWTFVPDEATIQDIQIVVDQTLPTLTYIYLDEIFLRENDPRHNILKAGFRQGFQFDIILRRVVDQVDVRILRGCQVYSGGETSGEQWNETIDGQFLDLDILPL